MAAEEQPIPATGTVINSSVPLSSIFSFHNVKIIFGLAAALALGVGIILWAVKPDYAPLFGHLSDHESAEIVDVLRAENVPFKIEPGSGLIMIPGDQIQSARMKLASIGLSQTGSGGYELLKQDQALGTSQFIESARYQHILETELSRTISGMRNIDTARVHLALPKQSAFVRKKTKASASVLIKLLPGRVLEQEQVSSIVHLVASSIPYLESSQVTVVDQWGRLLTTQGSSTEMALTSQQFEYTRKLEDTYRQRIESLLTPIVGLGAIRAEVNAEIDFSVNESTQEVFQPDESKVRSENIQESQSLGNSSASGIPGALTNQPPDAGTVGTGDQEFSDAAGEAGGSNRVPLNSNKNTVRNYELDKTINRTKSAQGEIRRLTVAVAIDDKVTLDDKGKSSKAPISEEELVILTSLVKEAVGFREARGDSVVVINKPFQAVSEIEPLPEPSVLEQPWVWTLVKQALSASIVLFILFGIIRPALKTTAKPAKGKGGEQQALSDDRLALNQQQKMAEALPPPPHVYGDILNMARAMAADDPKRVAKVVKDWLSSDV